MLLRDPGGEAGSVPFFGTQRPRVTHFTPWFARADSAQHSNPPVSRRKITIHRFPETLECNWRLWGSENNHPHSRSRHSLLYSTFSAFCADDSLKHVQQAQALLAMKSGHRSSGLKTRIAPVAIHANCTHSFSNWPTSSGSIHP